MSLHRAFRQVTEEMNASKHNGEHKIVDLLKQAVWQDNPIALNMLLSEDMVDDLVHRDGNLHLNALLREAMLHEKEGMMVLLIKEGARANGVFKRCIGESGEEIEFYVHDELGDKKPSQAIIMRANFHAGAVARTARALGLGGLVATKRGKRDDMPHQHH